MNAEINTVLFKLFTELDASAIPTAAPSAPPSAPAPKGDDEEDALDMYLSGLVDSVMHQYDVTDEEAADVVFACIDDATEIGKLPELPDEDASVEAIATWIGKATTGNLPKLVDDFAKAHAE